MKKKRNLYVTPKTTVIGVEIAQLMSGSMLGPRDPYEPDDTGWDQSDINDRPGYDTGDDDDWDQDEEP